MVEVGERVGRWTVIGEATPALDGQGFRSRVVVRCRCGETRKIFVRALGRSKGCRSRRCLRVWIATSLAERVRFVTLERLARQLDGPASAIVNAAMRDAIEVASSELQDAFDDDPVIEPTSVELISKWHADGAAA